MVKFRSIPAACSIWDIKSYAILVFLLLAVLNWYSVISPAVIVRSVYAVAQTLTLAKFSWAVFFAAWLGYAKNALVAALIMAAALGYGGAAAACLGGGRRVAGSTRFALGLGTLSLAMFGLGLAGLLLMPVVVALVLAGIAISIPRLARLPAVFRAGWPDLAQELRGLESGLLLAALAVTAAASGIMSLGPEGGWDAMFYHFELPRVYVLDHRIHFVPFIYPSNYTQGVEMLYLLGWMGGGEGVAKLVNLSFWPLTGCALWSLSRRLGAGVPLRAAALALTMPIAGALAAEGYVDLGLTFFELAALDEILRRRAGTAGFLLGCAMATKYTGIFGFAAALAAGAVVGMGAGRLAALAACAFVPLAPWLVKNAWFTGDPAAPFLSGLLGKLVWVDGISQAPLKATHGLMPTTVVGSGTSVLTGLWSFLKYGNFAIFCPFIFGLLPALALWRGTREERALKAYGLVFTVTVLALAPDGRYWQPGAFALCVPLAAAWTRFAGDSRFWRGILGTLAVAGALSGAFFHYAVMDGVLPGTYNTALGLNSRDDFYTAHRGPIGMWPAASFINGGVPRTERVGVICEVQAYLIDRVAVFDSDAPGSRRWIDNLALFCSKPGDWAKAFRKWNCRTILYEYGRAAAVAQPRSWSRESSRAFAEFWNTQAQKVFHSGDCSVYRIGPASKRGLRADMPGAQEGWLLEMKRASNSRENLGRVNKYALDAGVESARTLAVFGGFISQAGAVAEGVASLERAAALAPDEPSPWYWLAANYVAMGQKGRARDAYKKGLALDPEHDLAIKLKKLIH